MITPSMGNPTNKTVPLDVTDEALTGLFHLRMCVVEHEGMLIFDI